MKFIETKIDLLSQEKMWNFYETLNPEQDPLTPKLNCLSAKAKNDPELNEMMESTYLALNKVSDLMVEFYIDHFIERKLNGTVIEVSVLAAAKDIFNRLETMKFREGLDYYINLVLFWHCVSMVDHVYDEYFKENTVE